MPNRKEPHWAEGMLLLPQHLQVAQRYQESLIGAACDLTPFAWGYAALEIATAGIKDGVVALERCAARTAEGTWLVVPDNTDLAPRKLDEALDRTPDGVTIYLAIPRLHEIRPNATFDETVEGPPVRHLIEALERRDENTGDNPKAVEVHALRGRLLLGEERDLPGYELLPLARAYRSAEEGGAPRLDQHFIPPLLRCAASPALARLLREVVNDVGARNQELANEAEKREMGFATGVQEHVERLLMLHVLNEGLARLRTLVHATELHPFPVYAELCRLGGALAVFGGDRRVAEYPPYDHNKLGEIFRLVCEHVRALLRPFGPGTVQWRDFQPRDTGNGLMVTLDEAWLGEGADFFVGVHAEALDEVETDRLLRGIDWKIAALDDVDTRFAGGLNGLELRPVRGATGLLPSNPAIKYYRVHRDDELWPKVRDSRSLAMRYSPSGQARLENVSFRIYVVISR